MRIVSSNGVEYLPYMFRYACTCAAGTFTWGPSNLITSVPVSLLEPGTEATKLGTRWGPSYQ